VRGGSFDPQNTANTLNTIDHYDKVVFGVLCAETLRKAGSFDPKNTANKLKAMANVSSRWIQVCLNLDQVQWGFVLPYDRSCTWMCLVL
jgi:hypothetical protein